MAAGYGAGGRVVSRAVSGGSVDVSPMFSPNNGPLRNVQRRMLAPRPGIHRRSRNSPGRDFSLRFLYLGLGGRLRLRLVGLVSRRLTRARISLRHEERDVKMAETSDSFLAEDSVGSESNRDFTRASSPMRMASNNSVVLLVMICSGLYGGNRKKLAASNRLYR